MSTKRIADVVFCMDASASMRPCFAAVREHVGTFVNTLQGDLQTKWDVRLDFLAYSTGETGDGNGVFDFRSLRTQGLKLLDSLYKQGGRSADFFTNDVEDFKRGLAAIKVGGDEASFIALDTALDFPWRAAAACHRVVILLTDEALETGVLKPQQMEKIPALVDKIHGLRVLLYLVGPSSAAFDQISAADKSEYNIVTDTHNGLATADFSKILGSIAKSVSVSALQAAPATTGVSPGLFGQSGSAAMFR